MFDAGGRDVDLLLAGTDLGHWARAVARDTAHVVGTCRMGDPAAATTVVDPECRVLGIDGLRAVDASVFPAVTRANTHLRLLMVVERMADRLA